LLLKIINKIELDLKNFSQKNCKKKICCHGNHDSMCKTIQYHSLLYYSLYVKKGSKHKYDTFVFEFLTLTMLNCFEEISQNLAFFILVYS
jgi:hypothetical protein